MIGTYSKNDKRYYFIITIILLLSFLSYEIHIYEYYSVMQIFISVLLLGIVGLFFLYEKNPDRRLYLSVKRNYSIIILFIFMCFITILGSIVFGLNSPLSALYVLVMLCCLFPSFFILPSILNKNEKLFNYFINIVTLFGCILAILAIIIYYFPGVLPYTLESNRARSIYFDPNYLAMVLGIVAFLNMNNKKVKRAIFVCVLCGYAIFLTGSRGTVISVILACIIYLLLFVKLSIGKKLIIIMVMGGIILFCINYLQEIGFFRESQGSNGREEMLLIAIEALKESPFIGYGYQSVATYLIDIKKCENASTHNTFADYAFSYGYIALISYIIFIAKNFLKGLRNKNESFLMMTIIFMIINMNSIVYNLGGVGIGSLLFTILLGVIATRNKEN